VALKASRYIQHLKSPDNPDAVLHFLREIGVGESDITTAVSRDARILCSSLEKNVRPNIAKLLELGISVKAISGIISSSPNILMFNIAPKIDFWLGYVGSVENISLVLKVQRGVLVTRNLERILIPNLTFLKGECGLSPRQILRLIKSNPRIISCKPETLKKYVERADELGVARSSGTFLHALIIVGYLAPSIIDARLNNITRFGFSLEEVKLMISKVPFLLSISEETLGRKMEFLIKEVGTSHLISYPCLFTYSLENRLIPRRVVWKLLKSKGLPAANKVFASFMLPTEEKFLENFVLPNEHIIPGLHQAYVDAGKV
jgi:mTERF domain-containing protein, mitochondrial